MKQGLEVTCAVGYKVQQYTGTEISKQQTPSAGSSLLLCPAIVVLYQGVLDIRSHACIHARTHMRFIVWYLHVVMLPGSYSILFGCNCIPFVVDDLILA
jgi:hypothetical protein